MAPSQNVPVLTYEHQAMEIEVKANKLLSDTGHIPVPYIYSADFSHQIIDYDYFLMDFLSGLPWNKYKKKLSSTINHKLELEIADIQFEMNNIHNGYFGSILEMPERNFNDWFSAFKSMLNDLLNDLTLFSLQPIISTKKVLKLLENQQHSFEKITQPCLVHWDLWEGNIFVDQIKGEYHIVGITDFERAFWGDPLMELFFWQAAKHPLIASKYGPNFLSDPDAQIRRHWYNFYLYLIFYIETKSRGYPFWFRLPYKFVAIHGLRSEFRTLSRIQHVS